MASRLPIVINAGHQQQLQSGDTIAPAAIADTTVSGKLITGFSALAGVVAATDTILQAINKIVGNVSAIYGAVTAWSPAVTSDVGTITSYTSSGSYQKIGKTVFFTALITITNAGSGSGSLLISNFPVGSALTDAPIYGREDALTGNTLNGRILTGGTLGAVFTYNNTTTIITNALIKIAGHYFVA